MADRQKIIRLSRRAGITSLEDIKMAYNSTVPVGLKDKTIEPIKMNDKAYKKKQVEDSGVNSYNLPNSNFERAKRLSEKDKPLEIVSPEFAVLSGGVGAGAIKAAGLGSKVANAAIHGAAQGAVWNASNLTGSKQSLKGAASDMGAGLVGGAIIGAAAPFVKSGIRSASNKLTAKSVPFESEINWGNWNKEIPSNKPLMDEYLKIEKTAKQSGNWMKNPDGSAFTGTPEQFVQQNSSNFKKAFSNSKLINSNGSPIVMHHGTRTGNLIDNEFKAPSLIGNEYRITNPNTIQDHNSFSLIKESAEKYANSRPRNAKLDFKPNPKVYSVYANVEKPYLANDIEVMSAGRIPNVGNYDAVTNLDLGVNSKKNYAEIAIPYWNRVKSAIGNNGMFDMTNSDIYKGLAPVAGLYGLSQMDQKAYGGNLYEDGGGTSDNNDNGDTFESSRDRHIYSSDKESVDYISNWLKSRGNVFEDNVKYLKESPVNSDYVYRSKYNKSNSIDGQLGNINKTIPYIYEDPNTEAKYKKDFLRYHGDGEEWKDFADKRWNEISHEMSSINKKAGQIGNAIFYKKYEFGDTTAIHERSHAANPYPQINKIASIIDKDKRIHQYTDDPNEIYSRLMQLRQSNNLDPNKIYTIDDIREIKDKSKAFDIFYRYSDDDILRLINEVAYNNSSYYQPNIAAHGGNLYEDGGGTGSENVPQKLDYNEFVGKRERYREYMKDPNYKKRLTRELYGDDANSVDKNVVDLEYDNRIKLLDSLKFKEFNENAYNFSETEGEYNFSDHSIWSSKFAANHEFSHSVDNERGAYDDNKNVVAAKITTPYSLKNVADETLKAALSNHTNQIKDEFNSRVDSGEFNELFSNILKHNKLNAKKALSNYNKKDNTFLYGDEINDRVRVSMSDYLKTKNIKAPNDSGKLYKLYVNELSKDKYGYSRLENLLTREQLNDTYRKYGDDAVRDWKKLEDDMNETNKTDIFTYNYLKNLGEIKARVNSLRIKAIDNYGYNTNDEFKIQNYKDLYNDVEYMQLKNGLHLSDDQINLLFKDIASNVNANSQDQLNITAYGGNLYDGKSEENNQMLFQKRPVNASMYVNDFMKPMDRLEMMQAHRNYANRDINSEWYQVNKPNYNYTNKDSVITTVIPGVLNKSNPIPKRMVEELTRAAINTNQDPFLLNGLALQESTYGWGRDPRKEFQTRPNPLRKNANTRDAIVSNWKTPEENWIEPLDKYQARVNNKLTDKEYRNYIESKSGKKDFDKYMDKNPKLNLSDVGVYETAIKKFNTGTYNPNKPTHTQDVKNAARKVKENKELSEYINNYVSEYLKKIK